MYYYQHNKQNKKCNYTLQKKRKCCVVYARGTTVTVTLPKFHYFYGGITTGVEAFILY